MTLTTVERSFPSNHASAPGHFPGNPIIPGALLLSEVLRAIESDFGRALHPFQLRAAKFLHPLRPGERFVIEIFRSNGKKVGFRCTASGTDVLAGEIVLLEPHAGRA